MATFWKLFLSCVLFQQTFGVLRPRGVSILSKVFYDPSQQFHCLDGSGMFPFHYVNDDFCDCTDGSDEPGTAACSVGTFICVNHGYEPKTLPSSRVNDGICDCCDSSDEYNSAADCFNTCKELGEKALAEAKKIESKFLLGQEIREKYIKLGKEKKEEYSALLKDLNKQELEATKVKHEKQDEKDNAETIESLILSKEKEFRKAQEKRIAAEKKQLLEKQVKEEAEAQKAFQKLDVNKDGKLTAFEIQSFIRFDSDSDGKVSVEEARFYMHEKAEMNLEDFLSNGWEIMKPAFRVTEVDENNPKSISTATKETPSDGFEEKANADGTEADKMDQTEKENILKDAAMARKDFADADKLLRDIQAEIWHLKRKINSDFGEEDEFLALETQCFDFSAKQYLYKFCPFDKIVQIVKVNKDETLVGLWDKWSGPDGNRYEQMKFSRGATCWNGPSRSAEVNLKCGPENKVLSVIELSPCSYQFEFTSPSMCKELPPEISRLLSNDLMLL